MREELDNREDKIELTYKADENIDNDSNADNNEFTEYSEDAVSELKEWDLSEDEDIQEFLSRDYDVIAESRRRLQEKKKPHRAKKEKGNKKRVSNREKAANIIIEEEYDDMNTQAEEFEEDMDANATLSSDKPVVKKKEKSPKGKKQSPDIVGMLKSVWSKWLDIYHAHTMQILYGALGVLVLLLAIAIILTSNNGSEDKTDEEKTTTVEQSSSEEESSSEQETEPILPEAKDSDIHSLVVAYVDAAYIKADMEAVALVVDDTTNINVDKYKSRQKYIEAYENISCYKLESAIENAYIVFVAYDAKLYNINTLVPAAETFVVKYSETTSKYMIHNMTEAETLDSYAAKGSQFELISKLSSEVQQRLDAALASDAELKQVYDLMNNISSQATEPTTPEATEGSAENSQSTTPAS